MPRPRVLVTSRLPGDAVAHLSSRAAVEVHGGPEPLNGQELVARTAGCDAMVCLLTDRISADFLSSCPDLKLVANVAVGVDNIDVQAATERGILVTNTPGVLDETTADLAFGLMLSCARRIAEADRFIRAGRWDSWQPELMLGTDVYGKTLGLIGFGRIGQAVGRRALGFGMTVLYARRALPPHAGEEDTGSGLRHVALHELLRRSDFISIHCPLNRETHHLLGSRELSLLKPGAILVNTARGPIVDQSALIAALLAGRLKAAALDVFENEPCVPPELLEMDRVVLTPHIGSASIETRSAMARLAVDGLLSAFSGCQPANTVNGRAWETFLARARRCVIE